MKMNWQKEKDVEPYKHAIEECIEKGILADYLKRKGSEVVNMLTAEYDYETDIEVQRGEAYDEVFMISQIVQFLITQIV